MTDNASEGEAAPPGGILGSREGTVPDGEEDEEERAKETEEAAATGDGGTVEGFIGEEKTLEETKKKQAYAPSNRGGRNDINGSVESKGREGNDGCSKTCPRNPKEVRLLCHTSRLTERECLAAANPCRTPTTAIARHLEAAVVFQTLIH